MVSADDWRRNGQEKYLADAKLIFTDEFQRYSDKWEHEHCEFCMEKFSAADNDLHSGYYTSDRMHWICPECFEDFKEEFRWTISGSKFPNERNEQI